MPLDFVARDFGIVIVKRKIAAPGSSASGILPGNQHQTSDALNANAVHERDKTNGARGDFGGASVLASRYWRIGFAEKNGLLCLFHHQHRDGFADGHLFKAGLQPALFSFPLR